MAREPEPIDPREVLHSPFEAGTRLTFWLSAQPWALLGLPAVVTGLLGAWLPRRLARRGARRASEVTRESGLGSLAWAAADLVALAGLPRLRLSYAPLHSAFLYLFYARAAVSGTGALAAWAGAATGPDIAPGGAATVRGALRLVNGAMTAALIYATYVDGQRLQTTRQTLSFPGRTSGAPPTRMRVAHISDIHIERLTRRDEAMLKQLRRARPDLICLTGDYVNNDYADHRAFADLRALLAALGAARPRYGIFACFGNNDPTEDTRAAFRETGVQLLEDQAVRIDLGGRDLQILGVNTNSRADADQDAPKLAAALASVEGQAAPDLRLLLYHTPDLAPEASLAGVDLYLCGHTHGGQIRLPGIGALRSGSRFGRRFAMGLKPLGNGGYLHTSRGTGFEGLGMPRVRVLCPPQLALFDLTIGEERGQEAGEPSALL